MCYITGILQDGKREKEDCRGYSMFPCHWDQFRGYPRKKEEWWRKKNDFESIQILIQDVAMTGGKSASNFLRTMPLPSL